MTVTTGVSGHSNAGIDVVGTVEGDTVVDETGGSVVDATVVGGMFVAGTNVRADVDGEAVTVGLERESSVTAWSAEHAPSQTAASTAVADSVGRR